jgi:hypothetical protein
VIGTSVVVTSEGSAHARFHRALEVGTPLMVRAAPAELQRVGLDDALAICLVFLDGEPDSFPRAAARWVARLTLEQPVALTDANLALASLGALQYGNQRAVAESLSSSAPAIGYPASKRSSQRGLTDTA